MRARSLLLAFLALAALLHGAPRAHAATQTFWCMQPGAEPRTLGVYDDTGACVAIGSLDSGTHTFAGQTNSVIYQSPLTGAQPVTLNALLDRIVVATNYMGWADVGDVTSYTGSLDLTAKINQIVANHAGMYVLFPAGKWRHTAHLSCTGGTTISGVGWQELAGTPPSEPNAGTVFVQDYLAAADPKGIEATGTHCAIENLEIRQPQPAPGVGWTPNVGPWAIYSKPALYSDTGGHRLRVHNVMLRNVYNGILTDSARGGQFSDVYGQPFNIGLKVTGDGDTSSYHNIQLGWTFWSGNSNVLAYQKAHVDHYVLGRVDTPMMSNIFSWGANRGMRFFYDNSHSDGNYDGVATGVKIANIDLDNCNTCLAIEDNPQISISNFRSSPDPTTTGQCISSYGVVNPGADYGNLRLQINGGECAKPGKPGLIFSYAPSGTPLYPQMIKLDGFHITQPSSGSWSSGSPAIATPSAQATVQAWDITVDNVTDGATILGGNGTLVWANGPQNFQGNVTAYNFTALGSAPAYLLVNTSAGSDLKRWSTYNDTSGTWHLVATNDAGSAGTDAITITRSGDVPTGIALSAPTTAPTPGTSDNSTRVATTAFFVAQFGQPHTWSAAQTFSADTTFGGAVTLGASGSIQGNLYYSGGWKYVGNGFGAQFAFDNSVGGVALYAAPSNSSGAGAAATPVKKWGVDAAGNMVAPALATSGGTVKGTLCVDTAGVVYVKTTTGACL